MAVRLADVRRGIVALALQQASEERFSLPSEPELAAQLGASRTTVRSALLALEKDGLVRRVHGRRTRINAAALRLRARLNEDREYLEVLRAHGYEASTEVVGSEVTDGPEGRVLTITRLFRGDGRPAILSQDQVPVAHLTAPVETISFETSTFRFAARWCGQRLAFSVAEVIPAVADDRLAALLGLPAGTPLLVLEQQHLSEESRPVIRTRAYFHDALLRFSVVRAGGEG